MNNVKYIIVGFLLISSTAWSQTVTELHNLDYVVVSPNGPDDGGDFGPNTPGTQTSGIQEAFWEAKNTIREVYIVGGGFGNTGSGPVVYNLHTTLTIPWGQDWHMDGGDYIMNFTQTTGDCLVIDSAMNCQFRFGVIQAPNLQSGTLVRIKPSTIGPDNFIVIVSSIIHITAIHGNGNGTGLMIDDSAGGLVFSHIRVGEIDNCQTGLHVDGGTHLTLTFPNIHRCGTLLNFTDGRFHIVNSLLNADGTSGAVGANLSNGNDNIYTLAWEGAFNPGNALKFSNGSRANLIYAMGLPTDGVTNNATTPNNRIIATQSPGVLSNQPSVPTSNSDRVNLESHTMVVTILSGGDVTNWQVTDANGNTDIITGALFAGQSILLEPGDKIRLTYTTPPTWSWRAIR